MHCRNWVWISEQVYTDVLTTSADILGIGIVIEINFKFIRQYPDPPDCRVKIRKRTILKKKQNILEFYQHNKIRKWLVRNKQNN